MGISIPYFSKMQQEIKPSVNLKGKDASLLFGLWLFSNFAKTIPSYGWVKSHPQDKKATKWLSFYEKTAPKMKEFASRAVEELTKAGVGKETLDQLTAPITALYEEQETTSPFPYLPWQFK